jgi:hypothetical protein
MLGKTVTRKADKARFKVTGQTEDACWVLTPVHFGTAIKASPDELRRDYGLKDASEPKRADEQEGWNRLGAAFRETFVRSRRGVRRGPTPEETFEILTGDDADVARIAGNEDLLAEFEAGLLRVPNDVAKRLDAIVARRNAAHGDA